MVESLLNELRIRYFPPMMLWDNLNAVMLSHNPILYVHTKHIELDIHFVHERFMAPRLQVQHISAHEKIIEILTKPLSTNLFTSFADKLKVASLKPL